MTLSSLPRDEEGFDDP